MYTVVQDMQESEGIHMKWLWELNWNKRTIYARFGEKYVQRKIGKIQIYNPDHNDYNPKNAGFLQIIDGRTFFLVEISPAYHLDPELNELMEGFRG